MESLPLAFRLAGHVVPVLGEGEAAEAKRRLVCEAGGTPTDDPAAATIRLAFLAPASGTDPGAAAVALSAQGFLVNVVDHPALCDFTVPAIVDRAPVTVAVATGGASASLAKALKERLELLLPPALGGVALAIRAARDRVAARFPTVAERRAFWAGLLAPGGPLDPLAGVPDPETAIAAALAGQAPATPGPTILPLPAAGAQALTLAQVRALAAADVVVHPADVAPDILALARRDARRVVGCAPPADAHGRIVVLAGEGRR
ncbi:MAG: siroheme synthase [Sphingomonadaceae bacterium]